MYFFLKVAITALVVVIVSELARKYSLFAAAIASLPLTSILALVWLYRDTRDLQKISALSHDILWLVAPSLIFFLALPLLIQHGMKFYAALITSCLIMSAGYGVFIYIRKFLG